MEKSRAGKTIRREFGLHGEFANSKIITTVNQEVTQYIASIDQPWQMQTCRDLRETILRSVPGVEELQQYGKPHYKKDGKFVCTYNTAKAWVSFTIFNAGSLEVQQGLFEPGDDPNRKTIKIRERQNTDYDLFAKLLQQGSNSTS